MALGQKAVFALRDSHLAGAQPMVPILVPPRSGLRTSLPQSKSIYAQALCMNVTCEARSLIHQSLCNIAVDWLLMSDIGGVLNEIVDSQAFPDYQIPRILRRF